MKACFVENTSSHLYVQIKWLPVPIAIGELAFATLQLH